jgi:hypothetical protein
MQKIEVADLFVVPRRTTSDSFVELVEEATSPFAIAPDTN